MRRLVIFGDVKSRFALIEGTQRMAELKPVPGVAKVIVNGQITSGATTANVFHVDREEFSSSAWSQTEINALATAVRAAFVSTFLPLIHLSWTLGTVDAIDLTSDVGLAGSNTGSNAGGKTGTACVASIAQCVTWKIPRHYRGGHPRTYLAPPSLTQITPPSSFDSAHRTALENAANTFLTTINSVVSGSDHWHLTCVHRYRGYNVDPTTGRKTPIQLDVPLKSYVTGASVDSRVDTQRRRLGPDR